VEQILRLLEEFRSLFPEYADKKLYGVLAAADAGDESIEAARKAGLYVVTFDDELMRFHDEDGFAAKAY
jgi:RecB family endonuclease NucS